MKLNNRPIAITLILAALCWSYVSIRYASSFQNPKIAKLKLQPGFVAEHIMSPSEEKLGSWVSMCFDDKGRMLASDQYGGIYRLKIPAIGASDLKPEIEKIMIEGDTTTLGAAHGLLYAFNSLYVLVNNRPRPNLPKSSGFYRLQDTDGNDKFDKITLIKQLVGEGEHGPHSIKLAPDGKSLYIICGNYTDMPQMNEYRLPNTWAYDNLFPAIKDPRGHANDRKEPGGWIANVSPEGDQWTLISAGYRNPFDMAFNEAGDLFVYDADMEWDFGMPWYRPTRICHAVNGSEFGWRTGNGKWSPTFTDNLPAVINIGQGSPTNLLYLDQAKFPAKYSNTLLAFDWSFGIIHALHLKPQGASYTAEREEFLSGVPLPLTDGVIGPDGALYFLTGGRRLESDLYRVHYAGSEPIKQATTAQIDDLNQLRRSIEAYHKPHDKAIEQVWPYLSHANRHIQYAARIAVEHQPTTLWKAKALSEPNPTAQIQALLALVRSNTANEKEAIFQVLINIPYTKLPAEQQQNLWRTYEVALARLGMPTEAQRVKMRTLFENMYGKAPSEVNKSLCKLLVFLNSDKVVAKTMVLMAKKDANSVMNDGLATKATDLIMRNPQYGLDIANTLANTPPPNQIYYATTLAQAKAGWTPALREQYFKWYAKAFQYKGGNSFVGFLNKARLMALANVPESKKAYYNKLSGGETLSENGNDIVATIMPKGPGKNYSMKLLDSLFTAELSHRNFRRGQAMFVATTCSRCHSMAGKGGNIGPDLSQLGTRFTTHDILEAIVLPNKAISDQYAATEFQLKNGSSMVGKITGQDSDHYYISQNPYDPDSIDKVAKNTVLSKQYSSQSLMLPGLINSLNPEELKDMIAYLKAGGNPNHPLFK